MRATAFVHARYPSEANLVDNLCERYHRGARCQLLFRQLEVFAIPSLRKYLRTTRERERERERGRNSNDSFVLDAKELRSVFLIPSWHVAGLIYTNVSHVLLAVNPHRHLEHLYGAAVMQRLSCTFAEGVACSKQKLE